MAQGLRMGDSGRMNNFNYPAGSEMIAILLLSLADIDTSVIFYLFVL